MSRDDRKRPWRKLRVVVEVTVPPRSKATEKDLKYAIESRIESASVEMPRPGRTDSYKAAVRVKAFGPFYQAHKIKERNKRNASRN